MQASTRWTSASLGPRIAISIDQIHRTIGRGEDCIVSRQRRDSYNNALAETINGLFKAEVTHRRGPWRSFEAVE